MRVMVLMGCKRSLHIMIYAILSLWCLSFTMVRSSISYNSSSLDVSIRNFATEALLGKRTGTLINASLPANLSDIEASVIRLRTRALWETGANFTSIYIPPRVLPFPFVKRLAIVYQNLRNWSDYYYQVPGYSLAAPVVGFTAYDATNLSILGNETMLRVFGDLIAIRFSKITIKDGNSSELKCVKFGEGGSIQFRNLTEGNTCLTEGNGHFSIAVPSPESKKKNISIWWLIAFVICAGVILLGLISVACYKLVMSRKIRKLECESDKGVAFDMTWIGSSRMPSASMVRTQPVLEHGDIP